MALKQKQNTKITSWTNIFNVVGYVDSVNPKEEKLKQVISKYELPIKGKCGLSNCGTPHFTGYIVETESGKLTNIGHKCGKNYFGNNFTVLKNKLDREIDYLNKIEAIKSAKMNINDKSVELHGVEEDYKNIEKVYGLLRTERLDVIQDKLELMKRQKSSILSIDREASDSEVELEEARTGKDVDKPFYISETYGEIKGLNYIINRATIEAMFHNIHLEISYLKNYDENNKTLKELNITFKKIEYLEEHILKARHLITDGFNLFIRSNMEQLIPLVGKKKQRKFNRFLNCCF